VKIPVAAVVVIPTMKTSKVNLAKKNVVELNLVGSGVGVLREVPLVLAMVVFKMVEKWL
jgi:hypothetical protein